MQNINEVHSGSILLVQPYAPLLRNLAFLLKMIGFEVTTARSAEEALAALAGRPVGLIIADTPLPGMDGYDLLAAAQADDRLGDVPFIFTSAAYDLNDVLYALELGAADYVPKPFDIYDILDAIKRSAPQMCATQQPIAG